MQAIANTTTSIEVRSGRPARSSANGSTISAMAATENGAGARRIALLELLDALAKEAARTHQQDERHQEIHRGLAPGRVERDGDAAHHADQERGRDHAPERPEAADHHHHEG